MITAQDFNKSEEDLLLVLAEQLINAGEIRLSGPQSDKEKSVRARGWLNLNLNRFRDLICGDPRVVAYMQDKAVQNKVDIAAIVVDCLSAASLSFPLGTLAVLIVSGRLNSLCNV